MFNIKSVRTGIITVLFCFGTPLIFTQTVWIKHADNPVLKPGSTGSWDESKSVANTVLFHENIFKMWYEGDDGFGYAISVDGINWIKDSLNNPILQPGQAGSWDEIEINNASVSIINNTYHMWYSGIDFFDDNRIGHATSPDGINWTKDSLNPVLDHGNFGTWDDEEVIHPFVLYENNTYKMWYNGQDGFTQRILYATSPDGRVWNRFTQHPMLEPGSGGAWDNNELGPLAVVHHENLYHMWYTGWNNANFIQIGYATSPNGIDWTKDSVMLSHGNPGEWDDGAVALPFVMVDVGDSLFKMWYGGTDGILFQTGYATSDLPLSVEEIGDIIPAQFMLFQNYPNPFNPSTKIKFRIPLSPPLLKGESEAGGFITLKVYDVLGNEVVILLNEEKQAGEYEVEFSAIGGSVSGGDAYNLTSGVYFYQLKAIDPESRSGQGFIETKKMILMK